MQRVRAAVCHQVGQRATHRLNGRPHDDGPEAWSWAAATGVLWGPEALGYETGLWTAWRMAQLIEEECGVRYHTSQAWRILRQLGWSWQRPVGRAPERDEAKIQ